jgi:hypothetical protein
VAKLELVISGSSCSEIPESNVLDHKCKIISGVNPTIFCFIFVTVFVVKLEYLLHIEIMHKQ